MGFFELLLIAVLGLVVVGPKRLPETVRTVALWVGRLRRMMTNARTEMEKEFGVDEVRQQLHNEQVLKNLGDPFRNLNDSKPQNKADISSSSKDKSPENPEAN